MNTFIPDLNFQVCASLLDDKRLFKQAVEAKQIIAILTTGKTKDGRDYPLSMKHHPIVKAWEGYEGALCLYYNNMLREIKIRQRVNTTMGFIEVLGELEYPPWINKKVCEMYQAHLIRKDSIHYKFNVDPTIPFDWSLINYITNIKKVLPTGRSANTGQRKAIKPMQKQELKYGILK